MLRNLAGPHGGGYLLLALLPFGIAALLLFLYLVAMGVMTIWGAYEMGLGWLW
jgi:hypothetical protein